MKYIASIAAIFFATSAAAQSCLPTQQVYDELTADRWQEQRIVAGMTQGAVLEVWANLDTGTFTVIATLPNGQSCPLAAGTDFVQFAVRPNL